MLLVFHKELQETLREECKAPCQKPLKKDFFHAPLPLRFNLQFPVNSRVAYICKVELTANPTAFYIYFVHHYFPLYY